MKQNYRPKLRHIKNNLHPSIGEDHKVKESLTYFERIQKGNEYLMIARKNKK